MASMRGRRYLYAGEIIVRHPKHEIKGLEGDETKCCPSICKKDEWLNKLNVLLGTK